MKLKKIMKEITEAYTYLILSYLIYIYIYIYIYYSTGYSEQVLKID